jgi:hypothetical protein
MYSIDELTLIKNWVFNIQESGYIIARMEVASLFFVFSADYFLFL